MLYGITIVLITHEMDVVKRICHRLSIMENASIIETTSLANVFVNKNSLARNILYTQLSPKLPECIKSQLSTTIKTNRPLLKLFFESTDVHLPFISQASRELNLDINILLANIDRIDGISCGVLIVELAANQDQLQLFINLSQQVKLTVEILGYVISDIA
jgi:D-methionine transport system ATP-binding protein